MAILDRVRERIEEVREKGIIPTTRERISEISERIRERVSGEKVELTRDEGLLRRRLKGL